MEYFMTFPSTTVNVFEKKDKIIDELNIVAGEISLTIFDAITDDEQFDCLKLFKSATDLGKDEINVINALISITLYKNNVKALYTIKRVANDSKTIALTQVLKLN